MQPTYQVYRDAAQAVWQGWAQGCWRDDWGNPCLVQALVDAAGVRVASELPMELQLELDSHLASFADYCVTAQHRRERHKALHGEDHLWQFAVRWNDAPSRTRQEVAGMLDALADRVEFERVQSSRESITVTTGKNSSWEQVSEELYFLWYSLKKRASNLVATH